MLSFQEVKSKYPEARPVEASTGLEFNIHCRIGSHRKGGLYKMYINAESGLYHCHDCGAAGDAIKRFFPETEDAFPTMRIERESGEVNYIPSGVVVKRGGPMIENNTPSPGVVVPLSGLPDDHVAIEYLNERGFDTKEIKELPLKQQLWYVVHSHAGGYSRMAGRIVFPVRSQGELVGWQGRLIERRIDDDTREVWDGDVWLMSRRLEGGKFEYAVERPKYKTCPGMQRGQCLYNLDVAKSHPSKEVVITEGPLDVHAVGPQAVCTMGSITPHQKRILTANFESVIVLLDPDVQKDHPEGQVKKKYQDLVEDWQGLPCVALHLPDGKDPGSTSRTVIWQEIQKAKKRALTGPQPPL